MTCTINNDKMSIGVQGEGGFIIGIFSLKYPQRVHMPPSKICSSSIRASACAGVRRKQDPRQMVICALHVQCIYQSHCRIAYIPSPPINGGISGGTIDVNINVIIPREASILMTRIRCARQVNLFLIMARAQNRYR